MKKYILPLVWIWPGCALAQVAPDVALNFRSIPLVQFVQSTYRVMLKRDFVISPELLSLEKPISVSVRGIKELELPKFIENVLSSQGIKSELRGGIYFLSLAASSLDSFSGTPLRLTGNAASENSASQLSLLQAQPVASGDALVADVERYVYRPRNRKPDFVASVVNASFQSKPAFSSSDYVVLSGAATELEKMRKLAEQIDEPSRQVRVSATFVEVSTTGSDSLGVSVIADVLGAQLGLRLGEVGSSAFSLKTNNFQAVIDAISNDGRFKQIAAPSAVVDSNEKGSLSFGDSVPTISSTMLDRNGSPVQQVQYQQSGVLLNVLPNVLGAGRISVSVDGQISSFSPTTTGVSGSPTLSKRQVQTTVTVDDGEVLLIGGLNSNKTVSNSSGFSFFPKSWAATSQSAANTDLVLVICATVVKKEN